MDALVAGTIYVTIVHFGIVDLPVRAVAPIKVIQTACILQSLTARCTRLVEGCKAIANWAEMIQSVIASSLLLLLCTPTKAVMQRNKKSLSQPSEATTGTKHFYDLKLSMLEE
ncbi:hypothetical protein [Brevibacillus antibioticus]|uniref:hypothetical protein n=1 Tax=Brevibacillus antibioticus TaxID=2570228 RepID=UPI001ABFE6F3|nr:hypothetical protein [Brevibacillus antibioticus]